MSEQIERVKWYTRARKFPQLIGRTFDGTKIWGGPYTLTQVVVAFVLIFVGYVTMPLWTHFGFIGNAMLFGGVVYGSVWALGKIPLGSRSPLSMATGFGRALIAPTMGRIGGSPVRLRRPHAVRHSIVLGLPAAPTSLQPSNPPTLQLSAPAEPLTPQPLSAAQSTQPPRKPALSGVQAILAAHPAGNAQGPAASPEDPR